jgi:histidinol-phosphate/aromatic aminotransferase/cobyric acid decarboxylase-like protein
LPAEPRAHGGPLADELAAIGVRPEALADFSVNLNPYGPAPEMVAAIREAPVAAYPDSSSRAAREALAAACGAAPDEVVVGPGAADLLWTAARALLAPGQSALVVEPAFAEFRAGAGHARVHEWRARAEDGFALDEEAVVESARRREARLVLLGAPGNPTGRGLPAARTAALAAELPQAILVVDESFLALSDDHADARVPLPANVIRVRSLTKEHAIAGVRVGYALATRELAARLETTRPAWSTSAPAQAAAEKAPSLDEFVADCRARLRSDRLALATELRALGLRPVPSSTCFMIVPVADARALRHRLLARHAVLVRDCTSFGLPGHIRVAARPAGQRERLLHALKSEL